MEKPEKPKPGYEEGTDFDTPMTTSPEIFLPEAHGDDKPINKAATPLVLASDVVAKLCETLNKNPNVDDENPYATYEANDADDETPDVDDEIPDADDKTPNTDDKIPNIDDEIPDIDDETHVILEELFLRSKLPQQQIFDTIREQIDKAEKEDNNKKAEAIWLTSIDFMNKIIQQTFVEIRKKIEKTEINELWFTLISNFQYCWQKIISKEGKIYFIEEMRALVKQTKDQDTKERLFAAFILSIINTIEENDENDDPFIKIPDEIRNSFPKANISEEDVTEEQYPERISPSILLPMDKDYIEIHDFLSSSDDEIAKIMLELIEQDFFTDEQWEKISCGNKEEFIKICENLPQTIAEKIGSSTDNIDTFTEEMVEIMKRAWNKIIFPRHLVWEEIIYSDELLLPKEKE